MSKRIYIGRDDANDWIVPESFNTVSNNHANIEETENGHLLLVDHSRNGTVVNGIRVKDSSIEIKEGDNIRLANSYLLSWSQISYYFPKRKETVRLYNDKLTGRETELHNTPRDFAQIPIETSCHTDSKNRAEVEIAKSKWNWSAFLLNWIWGVGHDCWWPLFAYIGLGLLSTLFIVAIPIIPFITPISISISNLATLAISIYLGVKGNSLAWQNGCFDDINHFERKEKRWLYAAIAVWCIYILFVIFIVSFSFVTAFSILDLYGRAFDFS